MFNAEQGFLTGPDPLKSQIRGAKWCARGKIFCTWFSKVTTGANKSI